MAESNGLQLRGVIDADLPVFFAYQQDEAAYRMATFLNRDPADENAFMAHWEKIRKDPTIFIKTIVYEGHVAGHVASFETYGMPEVTYWIGRQFWGKGLATRSLTEFLRHQLTRPIYGVAAKDNLGSIRVLEKCGFVRTGQDMAFSKIRGEEVEQVILELKS